ncbi:MAG: hypothetical protein ACP5VR_12550 [Acidimicrobiales bacterium]
MTFSSSRAWIDALKDQVHGLAFTSSTAAFLPAAAARSNVAQARSMSAEVVAVGTTTRSAKAVHLLASLADETEARIAEAVTKARQGGCSWAGIADCLVSPGPALGSNGVLRNAARPKAQLGPIPFPEEAEFPKRPR